MMCPKTASGKLRKPDLRVIGKGILGEVVVACQISARLQACSTGLGFLDDGNA